MIKYENKLEPIKIPVSFICDKCEEKYNLKEDFLETQEFVHINDVGGYGSIFGDGEEIKYDICQHCLRDFMRGKQNGNEYIYKRT